ncbi:bifunctional hydroxymethylpyrimidine kinase/phosphomethylpyrimidine kinase [Algirhabdus cladophorae]|uniref:bifunctional hydroxymethylpyrimidine kinase/phosphomethylpyrimidine kinase n=1 Tax=Algirhabdus cladophorae TaxID=3377108 RepID=UPI003B84A3CC
MAGTPIALTIAGSDSGGGAGIQADLKAFSANGAYGASVVTAITAQNTKEVSAVHAVPVDIVSAQIKAVLDDLDVDAIKIGMLFSPELIEAVAQGLAGFTGPIILDPVMVAKSGDALLQSEAVAGLIDQMLPLATVLTPNLPEAALLLDQPPAKTDAEAVAQGQALLTMGPRAVLLKGGHAEGDTCTDFLLTADAPPFALPAPRVQTQNTHGTGCTYSASIAALMAKGLDLPTAVQQAHSYLHQAILQADTLQIGSGHGPVHHFHAHWTNL